MPPALRRAAPALTPALALDYVRELSADVRAGVVLDAAGAPLAGPDELATAARALLEAGGDAAELEAATAGGVVCAVRSAGHAMVAVCGRFAIPAVVRGDMRAALAAVEGRAPAAAPQRAAVEERPGEPRTGAAGARAGEPRVGAPGDEALARAAEALISAAQRGFGA
jgi:hypothetical protein